MKKKKKTASISIERRLTSQIENYLRTGNHLMLLLKQKYLCLEPEVYFQPSTGKTKRKLSTYKLKTGEDISAEDLKAAANLYKDIVPCVQMLSKLLSNLLELQREQHEQLLKEKAAEIEEKAGDSLDIEAFARGEELKETKPAPKLEHTWIARSNKRQKSLIKKISELS